MMMFDYSRVSIDRYWVVLESKGGGKGLESEYWGASKGNEVRG
jgi:hypothetical protein